MDEPTILDAHEDPDTKATLLDARPPTPPKPKRHWGWRLLATVSITVVVGALLALVGLVFLTQDLPELRSLDDYRPPQASVVYGHEGEVVGRFSKERRTVVPFKKIPRIMIDAVIASEDADFFKHEGVDILGIARCVVKNFLAGRKRCGGSTITQQTVKTFFLTPEKTYLRKTRELILAKRVEEALSKEDILFLYLNQIYFGHGAYGVQEAAQVYFGKDVEDIKVHEAALLAGLPQSPSRLDPYKYEDRARKRRTYVLSRLHELGKIDNKTHEESQNAPIELASGRSETYLDNNSHYIAHVRAVLTEELGEDVLFTGGLSVHTGLDPLIQSAADSSLERGVEAIDKRQGWRGPLLHLEPPEAKALIEALEARRANAKPKKSKDSTSPLIWDLSSFGSSPRNLSPRHLAERARMRRVIPGGTYGGIVIRVEDASLTAVVALSDELHVNLPFRTALRWARPFNVKQNTPYPTRPSEVLKKGDIVLVRTKPSKNKKGVEKWRGTLEQRPLAQAAVVVIDPQTREVRALSGGYGPGAGTFNRAIQARRQPGSTFKPIVYAAAFATRKFTPISECLDAPRVYRDPYAKKSWKPQNYSGTFDGVISLRRALTLSKNLCSVELIDKIGVDTVLKTARRMGLRKRLPRNLTLALGSGDVTPLEMTNALTTLADNGRYAEPIFIRKVVNAENKVLLESKAQYEQALDPAVAYQVVSLMQSVVEEGTAQRVKALNRPVAGKTGTTNESRNAWFIGFTPQLVTGVWVGLDDNRPLGPSETGGRAAIPIWLKTMTAALKDKPALEFVAPSDVVFAHVDPETRKLAPPNHPGARTEPFLPGTEPTEVLEPGVSEPGLWDDYE